MGKSVYSAKFKADRVLEVLAGEEQIGEIAARHNINPNMLRMWKKEFTLHRQIMLISIPEVLH